MTSGSDAPAGPDDPGCVVLHLPDEAALAPLARKLLAALPTPAVVAVRGDLGAGKTTLVKQVAAAIGIDPAVVVSPTFGLLHEHATTAGTLLHADLYRLADPGELDDLGWHDAVARSAWAFVEWPERAAGALPADRLDVAIEIDGPGSRTLRIQGHGPRHGGVAARLRG